MKAQYIQSKKLTLVMLLVGGGLVASLLAFSSSGKFFVTSSRCLACHNGLVDISGKDVSFGLSWWPTMMANSARDPYWQAGVRREIIDHPQAREIIENECSICHMPMSNYKRRSLGGKDSVFEHLPATTARDDDLLALDGVSCSLCHQIDPQNFGQEESFSGRFKVEESTPQGKRIIYGPFKIDEGRQKIMQSSSGFTPHESQHIQQAELCATCHTLFTHSLDEKGEVVGELPEQVPYLEWRHSDYDERISCQECHMPHIDGPLPISGVMGQDRDGLALHVFRGGNFFMPLIFNRYRLELGVKALPQELEVASQRTRQHLAESAASLGIVKSEVQDGILEVLVKVENLAGHKLPTAYPSRRVWLRFEVRDEGGQVIFVSGELNPDGSIKGNDNDKSPESFEPHYEVIDSLDKVQIYEPIMVDVAGKVTTGLLRAVKYVKDNRLLPIGFEKEKADESVAVRGKALTDVNFSGGEDIVTYRVPVKDVSGAYQVKVEMWYQPIGFRWARNLNNYQALETERFGKYYREMGRYSATQLAKIIHKVHPTK